MDTAGQIRKTSEAITKFGAAVKTAADRAGKIDELVKVAEKLSKLSAGLGAVGAGLGLAATLVGMIVETESETDRVLRAISDLSTQVESLNSSMDRQFEQLSDLVTETAAKTQLFPQVARIKTLCEMLDSYRKHCEKDPKSAESRNSRRNLRGFQLAETRIAANAIYMSMCESGLVTNVLGAAYRLSAGDYRVIDDVGGALFSLLTFALVAEVAVKNLGDSDDAVITQEEAAAIQQDAVEFYGPKIERAQSAWDSVISRCHSELASNVNKKTGQLVGGAGFDSGNHQASANWLCSTLHAQFPWLDWISIVYDDVDGSDNHGYWGDDCVTVFHTKGVNVIVHWVDKSNPPLGSGLSTIVIDRYSQLLRLIPPGYWHTTFNVEVALQRETSGFSIAAENAWWSDIEVLAEMILTRSGTHRFQYQSNVRGFVWHCRRLRGVWSSCTNNERLLWKNGSTATVCVYW